MSPVSEFRPFGGGSTTSSSVVSKRPESYGAKCDGKVITDAAISVSTATLTSATAAFVSADAGKAITINGAGLNVNQNTFTTTILSVTNATTVVLAANAAVTVSGARATYGTDDTAAIKSAVSSAVSACQSDGTNYCEVHFSAGMYMIAGATTVGGATMGNAQIPLPVINPGTGQKVTLVLKGTEDAATINHWHTTLPQSSGAAVLRTTLIGLTSDGTYGAPSVIGGPTIDIDGDDEFSNMRVVVDGLVILAPKFPSLVGFDLRRCAQAHVGSVATLVDQTAAQMVNTLSDNSLGIGLYMPRGNNNDGCAIDDYTCEGWNIGLAGADHMSAQTITLIYCTVGIYVLLLGATGYHGSAFNYVSCEGGDTAIYINGDAGGSTPIHIALLDIEVQGGTYDIDDQNNTWRGYIGWASNTLEDPSVRGGANIRIENVMRKRGMVASQPSVPASTVTAPLVFKDAAVNISGGTVTAITVDGVATGLIFGTVIVPSGKTIAVTYSVAPSWKWTLL